MKILHTSDWHLGHVLHSHNRDAEHLDFLLQLQNIVKLEQPDALVVSGDIFDRPNPSNNILRIYCDALLAIHDCNPSMSIIVTAGNHDSKSLLETNRQLWNLANVTVIGNIERIDGQLNLNRHIIPVSRNNEIIGYIIALPHIYDQAYPQFENAGSVEERKRAFHQLILDEVKLRNTHNRPVVMMAHLALVGSSFKGHDDTIGGMDIESVDHNNLGTGFDYLALGHIHCPQTLDCNGAIARYCGSPIAVSFDEDYAHSVSIVSLAKGKAPEIVEKNIKNIRPLLTIPATPRPFEEALNELAHLSNDAEGYVRLNVLEDAPLPPNRVERIMQCVEGKNIKYCLTKISRSLPESEDSENCGPQSFEEFRQLSPLHIANSYYTAKFGTQMPDEMSQMLQQVINIINTEKHD